MTITAIGARRSIALLDTRTSDVTRIADAHAGVVNQVQWGLSDVREQTPLSGGGATPSAPSSSFGMAEHLLLSTGSDLLVRVFDVRHTSKPWAELSGHNSKQGKRGSSIVQADFAWGAMHLWSPPWTCRQRLCHASSFLSCVRAHSEWPHPMYVLAPAHRRSITQPRPCRWPRRCHRGRGDTVCFGVRPAESRLDGRQLRAARRYDAQPDGGDASRLHAALLRLTGRLCRSLDGHVYPACLPLRLHGFDSVVCVTPLFGLDVGQ